MCGAQCRAHDYTTYNVVGGDGPSGENENQCRENDGNVKVRHWRKCCGAIDHVPPFETRFLGWDA